MSLLLHMMILQQITLIHCFNMNTGKLIIIYEQHYEEVEIIDIITKDNLLKTIASLKTRLIEQSKEGVCKDIHIKEIIKTHIGDKYMSFTVKYENNHMGTHFYTYEERNINELAKKNITKNSSFKITGNSTIHGKQLKKRVYIEQNDYIKYHKKLDERWTRYYDVTHYEFINGEWIIIKQIPATERGRY